MAFDNTPNRLDAAFIQRDRFNQYYEQINISGSNLIIYLDETGSLTADRVSVWAAKYSIGSGGSSLSSSWASSSISSSYALTASFALNGGGGGGSSDSASWASSSVQAYYATQSLYATNSIYALTASYAYSSSYEMEIEISSSWASQSISSSHAEFSDEAFTADTVNVTAVSGKYDVGLLGSNTGVVNVYADNNGNLQWDVASQTLYADVVHGTSSWATQSISASYISASNIVGAILSASYAGTASFAYFAFASQSISASYALLSGTASILYNPTSYVDGEGNAGFTSVLTLGGSGGTGKFTLVHPGFSTITMQSGSITASYYNGTLLGLALFARSASWASASISASYATTASYAFTSISSSIAATASYITASAIIGYVATASVSLTASFSKTASYVATTLSSSWASSSISASYALSASHAKQADDSLRAISASYAPVTGIITNAETASVALSINFIPSASLSASWASSSVSASYAASASWAYAINFVPPAATSASWVSASAFITTAQTASFVTASNVRGVVSSASYAYLAVSASSLTFVPNSANFTTQSLFATQSTFATNSLYASQSAFATQSTYATESLNATQSIYATQSLFATQSISASLATTASFVTSGSWSAFAVSSSHAVMADTASIAVTVLTASYVSASGVDGNVSASNYAITSSTAWHAYDSDRAISASYAPVSGEVDRAVSASHADTASLVVTASYSLATQNALTADFALLAGEAISADFAVVAGNTLYTSSYALTASIALMTPTASYAGTASYAINAAGGASASWASSSLSASLLYNTGYVPSIVTQNYRVGNKQYILTNTASSALTVTLSTGSNVYVKFTYHGYDSSRGSCFFMGEYFLQKENDAPIFNKQPGEILSQYNSNHTINVQSVIPDIAYDTGSAAIAIQLMGTASFTGSLVYEIRGVFTDIDQPYVPAVSGSAFGDTFETYPFGLINALTQDSPAFGAPGAIASTAYGLIAFDNFDAYPSGSSPTLDAGSGWVSAGYIN